MLNLFTQWTKSPDKSTTKSVNISLTTNPKTPSDNDSTKKTTPQGNTNNNSIDEKSTERKEDLEKTYCEEDLDNLKLIREKISVQEIVSNLQNQNDKGLVQARKNWDDRLKPILEKKLYEANKVYNDHILKLEQQIEKVEFERRETVRMTDVMREELEERLKTGIVEIIAKKISQKAVAFEEEKSVLQKQLDSIMDENTVLKHKIEQIQNKTTKSDSESEDTKFLLKSLKNENVKWSKRFIERESDYKKLQLEFNKLKSKEIVMQKTIKILETEISNINFEKDDLKEKITSITDRQYLTNPLKDEKIGSPDNVPDSDPRSLINSRQISSRSNEIDRNLYTEMKTLYQDMKSQLATKLKEVQIIKLSEKDVKQQFNSALSVIEDMNQKNIELNEKVEEIEKNLESFLNEFDQIFTRMKAYEISEEQNFKELSTSFCNYENFEERLDMQLKKMTEKSYFDKSNIGLIKKSVSGEYTNLIKYSEYLNDKIEVKNNQIKQLKAIFSKHYCNDD